jgi:hypothetical protein
MEAAAPRRRKSRKKEIRSKNRALTGGFFISLPDNFSGIVPGKIFREGM